MRIDVDIRRSDIAAFSLYLLPRDRSNRITLAVVAVVVFLYIVAKRDAASSIDYIAAVVTAVFFAIVVLLGGFVVSLIFIILKSNEKSGVLGKHTYTISADGLHEVTAQNEGLQKWAGIEQLGKSDRFIWLRINAFLFHLIPRRAFDSEQEFNAFWERICQYQDHAA